MSSLDTDIFANEIFATVILATVILATVILVGGCGSCPKDYSDSLSPNLAFLFWIWLWGTKDLDWDLEFGLRLVKSLPRNICETCEI